MKQNELHNINTTGFKTPDQYFDGIEEKILKHLFDKGSLDSFKNTGFEVPKNYFDTVEDSMFSRISEEETRVIKLISKKNWHYVAGIAASLLLLLAVFINRNNNTEELSVEMVENYLENSDLDSYELAELLSDVDLLEEDFIITETQYKEDSLEDYLLKNTDLESFLD
ncbi:hypothetical protein [uncultured Winogradskyella sp.]|uniref:hypothetical protein n=1 Tax=uncultured Winogradskyella sp. TaxID=395353 RepID=UPI0026021F0C|nr:hypothetical protein [uncultured Winogradskyella sp.]